jgi:MFS family permease
VIGWSAIQTGAIFLPMTVLIMFVAPAAGKFSDRIGSRWLMAAGMLLLTGSLLDFAQLDQGSNFWNALPALILGGFGMSLVMTPTTAAAMGSVAVEKAGVGSAVINSMRQVGGSLGIAVMGAVVATQVHTRVPGPQLAAEFTRGYHDALYVAAGITLGAAVVAVSLVRRVIHPHPTPEAVGA